MLLFPQLLRNQPKVSMVKQEWGFDFQFLSWPNTFLFPLHSLWLCREIRTRDVELCNFSQSLSIALSFFAFSPFCSFPALCLFTVHQFSLEPALFSSALPPLLQLNLTAKIISKGSQMLKLQNLLLPSTCRCCIGRQNYFNF